MSLTFISSYKAFEIWCGFYTHITSQFKPATSQVLKSRMWPVATLEHSKCWMRNFSKCRMISTGRQENSSVQRCLCVGVEGRKCVLELMKCSVSGQDCYFRVRLTWTEQACSQPGPGTACTREFGFVNTVLCVCNVHFLRRGDMLVDKVYGRVCVDGMGASGDITGAACDWDVRCVCMWACVGGWAWQWVWDNDLQTAFWGSMLQFRAKWDEYRLCCEAYISP